MLDYHRRVYGLTHTLAAPSLISTCSTTTDVCTASPTPSRPQASFLHARLPQTCVRPHPHPRGPKPHFYMLDYHRRVYGLTHTLAAPSLISTCSTTTDVCT